MNCQGAGRVQLLESVSYRQAQTFIALHLVPFQARVTLRHFYAEICIADIWKAKIATSEAVASKIVKGPPE